MSTPGSTQAFRRSGGWMARFSAGLGLLVAMLLTSGCGSLAISPWPGAMLTRALFDAGGDKVSQALLPHVPAGVQSQLNIRYDENDPDALLDVHYPARLASPGAVLPVVVWTHGGGWLSGNRGQVNNYAKVLAGQGFTVVTVDYSLAPGSHHPKPARQINTALSYLDRHAEALHIDRHRFVLAGDSAGANLSAQVAISIGSPDYARALAIRPGIRRDQLQGLLLYCGPYDLREMPVDGVLGRATRTMLWSYSGRRDYLADPAFVRMSVIDHVTRDFPPSFISVGNGDPLMPQAQGLAQVLTALGVRVDTLFFAKDHVPLLGHEYQFNLDSEAGQQALSRSVRFLRSLP